jgi:hypothetical protein
MISYTGEWYSYENRSGSEITEREMMIIMAVEICIG